MHLTVQTANPKGAHFISLLDTRKTAETEKATYPQVLAKLTAFIVGTPSADPTSIPAFFK